jgi:VWFA-related protein
MKACTILKGLPDLAIAGLFAMLLADFSGQRAAAQAGAQDAATSSQRDSDPGAGQITIHVVVGDKLDHPVRGLEASDFTVLDNKQPQKLLGFRAEDAESSTTEPVRIVIVVDMLNNGVMAVARAREEIGVFLKEDGGKLANPTSIAIFADGGLKVQNGWTRDGNELLAVFNKTSSELRVIGRNSGFNGDAERLEMSLNQLDQLAAVEAEQPGRKLLMVIGGGWPLLARAGDESDLKQRTWVFNSIMQLTNGFREANIGLYCLDPYGLGRTNPFYYEGYLKGVAAVKDATYPNLALQVLAVHSGGQVLINGSDITADLNTAIRDASAGYDLTFAAAPGDRTNEYHALQVQVDKPNVKARTVAGYYAHTIAASR